MDISFVAVHIEMETLSPSGEEERNTFLGLYRFEDGEIEWFSWSYEIYNYFPTTYVVGKKIKAFQDKFKIGIDPTTSIAPLFIREKTNNSGTVLSVVRVSWLPDARRSEEEIGRNPMTDYAIEKINQKNKEHLTEIINNKPIYDFVRIQ